jgi:NAD(P)H-flavin reductase
MDKEIGHMILLRHVKPGQFVEVVSNGNGLLKNITVGKIYEVTKVSNRTQRFFFRNDLNKPTSYHLKSNCWFKIYK